PRKGSALTFPRRFGQPIRPAPRLDHDVLGHSGSQYLVPANHEFVMLADNLLHTIREILLQFLIALQIVCLHELADLGIRAPLLPFYFVAPMRTYGARK